MNETLSGYLKRIRKERDLTLRSVEEKTGISNAYVSQVENGKISAPSPSVLNKLARCYDVSYEYLMKLAGHPLPTEKVRLESAFRISSSFDDLTDEERKRVREYIEFLRSRRRRE